MKTAWKKFLIVVFISVCLTFIQTPPVLAYCHILTDPTGDSGSSFSFTDVVGTELSDAGDAIGVKITSAGNIPNGFGTTGVMIYSVLFPSSLLSQDPQDSGINAITVHWKEDGSGWEGSQFISHGKDTDSKPWPAQITLDGKTAFFKIPKSLIGHGKVAYQIAVGFLSKEAESTDTVPNGAFSDCISTQEVIPTSQPQEAQIKVNQSPPLENSISGPVKVAGKLVEKPGVVRVGSDDIGKSLRVNLPSPSPVVYKVQPSALNFILKNSPVAAVPVSQPALDNTANKPSGLLIGFIVIALVGTAATGAAYMFTNSGNTYIGDKCAPLRVKVAELKAKIAKLEIEIVSSAEKVKTLKEQLVVAQKKAESAVTALKNHLRTKQPSGDDFMDYEGKRHYMKDYGYKTGKDIYDQKTQEMAEKKAQAEQELAAAENAIGEGELELEKSKFILEESQKTLVALEKDLAMCEKRLAQEKLDQALTLAKTSLPAILHPDVGAKPTVAKPKLDLERSCKTGETQIGETWRCTFTLLDENGEVKFETPYRKGEGTDAKDLEKLLKAGALISEAAGYALGGTLVKVPLAVITKLFKVGGEIASTLGKMAGRLPIDYIEYPICRIQNVCSEMYVCKNSKWVKEVQLKDSVRIGQDSIEIKYPEYKGQPLKLMDLADFIAEEKKRFADSEKVAENPCVCSNLRGASKEAA